MLDLYESNTSLFDHGNLREFLLFVFDFKMTLAVACKLEMDVKNIIFVR